MKVEVAVLGSTSLIVFMTSVDVKQHSKSRRMEVDKAHEMCESRGGRHGSPSLTAVAVDEKQH